MSETISKSIDEFINSLKYDGSGLIPAVVQDALTKEVLMVAYMNPESLKSTITSGKATYFSRSRQKLWVKGRPPVTSNMSGGFSLIATGIRYSLRWSRRVWPAIQAIIPASSGKPSLGQTAGLKRFTALSSKTRKNRSRGDSSC